MQKSSQDEGLLILNVGNAVLIQGSCSRDGGRNGGVIVAENALVAMATQNPSQSESQVVPFLHLMACEVQTICIIYPIQFSLDFYVFW